MLLELSRGARSRRRLAILGACGEEVSAEEMAVEEEEKVWM